MWKYQIEERHLVGFLLSGKLDKDLDELFESFWEFTHSFQFELIKYVKTKGVFPSLKVIKKVFKIKEETAKELMNERIKTFCFPAVGDTEAVLINGLVIPNISEVITNVESVKRYLKPIREFLNSGFGVFFDREFSGKSFQLPLALSLYLEDFPKRTLFTGAVDKDGNIREVDGIPKKRELAKRMGWHFVEPSNLSNIREIKEWYEKEAYDVPFYITKTTSAFEGEWQKLLSSLKIENPKEVIKNLSILNGVENLVLTVGQLNNNWEDTLRNIAHRFKEVETKLKGRDLWHIAINGPSTLAFGIGALFGSQKPFVFYHMQNNVYNPIEVKNVRYLKERTENLEEVEYKLWDGGPKLVVILSLSHHELEGDVRNYVSFLENPSFLVIRYAKAGNIDIDRMPKISKEIASILQDVRRDRSFEDFHFFFSCPVPIAFMLGVAFGHYNQGVVYNFQKELNTYTPVFKLSLVRNLREGAHEKANL